jgi:hypothetical protein
VWPSRFHEPPVVTSGRYERVALAIAQRHPDAWFEPHILVESDAQIRN